MTEIALEKKATLKESFQKFCDALPVAIICRLVIGVMFVLSGIGKMMDLTNSVKAVHDFRLPILSSLPAMEKFIGTVLPFAELILAICILVGVFTRLSAAGIGALSLVFFFGKFHVLFIQGRSVNCGCFGELMNTMAEVTIYLDIPILILCIILILSAKRYIPGVGQLLSEPMKQKLAKVW